MRNIVARDPTGFYSHLTKLYGAYNMQYPAYILYVTYQGINSYDHVKRISSEYFKVMDSLERCETKTSSVGQSLTRKTFPGKVKFWHWPRMTFWFWLRPNNVSLLLIMTSPTSQTCHQHTLFVSNNYSSFHIRNLISTSTYREGATWIKVKVRSMFIILLI